MINEEKNSWQKGRYWPWLVSLFLLFATTLSYLDRNAFSVVSPTIQKEFNWDNHTIGQVLSAFFLAYGIMHIFVGFILDRTNIRFSYGFFVLFWSIAQIGISFAQGFMGFFASRFALGIFESAGHPGGTRIIARIVPRKDRTLANSMLISGGSLGALIAPPLMIYLNNTIGWRYGFIILGLLGIIWTTFWLSWFKPPEEVLTGKVDGKRTLTDADQWSTILKNPKIWACVVAALLVTPILHITYSWSAIYFVQEWNMEMKIDLAKYLFIIALGFEASLYVTGILISVLSRKGVTVGYARKIVLTIAGILMFSAAFITKSSTPIMAVGFLFVLNFGRAAFNTLFYSFIQEIAPQRVGTLAGFMGAIGALSGATLIHIIGFISEGQGFGLPFLIVGCMGLLGVIPILLVKWD